MEQNSECRAVPCSSIGSSEVVILVEPLLVLKAIPTLSISSTTVIGFATLVAAIVST